MRVGEDVPEAVAAPVAGAVGEGDRARVRSAVAGAARAAPWLDPDAFAFVTAVLTVDTSPWPAETAPAVLDTALRTQQLTGPAMAKGLEDTALYRYARLIALNEVADEALRKAYEPAGAAYRAAGAEERLQLGGETSAGKWLLSRFTSR